MIYLSGPMTSKPNDYKRLFKKAEDIVKVMYKEDNIINPVYISDNLIKQYNLEGKEFDDVYRTLFMKEDIKTLLMCDTICMLPDWEQSKGATFEREVALQCGLKVIEITDSTFKIN